MVGHHRVGIITAVNVLDIGLLLRVETKNVLLEHLAQIVKIYVLHAPGRRCRELHLPP